jgi:TolB-like protein
LGKSYIFLRHYEEALEACKKMELGVEKEYILSWIYQELGREEEARVHMEKVLEIAPDLSLESIKISSPYMNPVHLKRELDAYRKAGMPEKPPGAVQEKPSIAVLPFDDLSPQKDQEYFVLGLSEEILNSLAQIPDLSVIAKTSSFSFKDKDKTIQEIASVLDVDHILEGSVRKAGNAIRITAQLIKGVDGSHLWSKTYDKELTIEEMFSIQEGIATGVAEELKISLGIGKSLRKLGGTDNMDAYELYLVAQGTFSLGELAIYSRMLELLDTAISLDPEFANAWALKADIHRLRAGFAPPNQSVSERDLAISAAHKAIELEPNLADGYLALASIKVSEGDWIEAELAYQKGVELIAKSLDPEFSSPAYYQYQVGHIKRANELFVIARNLSEKSV